MATREKRWEMNIMLNGRIALVDWPGRALILLLSLCIADGLFVPVQISGQGIIWDHTYGGEQDEVALSAQQTRDGGYILAGYTESFGEGCSDVYLIKTDPNGIRIWERTYGGNDYDAAYSVQQTKDDEYILTGFTGSYGAGEHDVFVIKTDEFGDTLWTRTIGGSSHDCGYCIDLVGSDGYVICGFTTSFGAGGSDYYLIRLSASGDSLWARTYGESGWEYAHSIQYTSEGNFIIAGHNYTPLHRVFLLKTDIIGDSLWSQIYGVRGTNWCNSIKQNHNTEFVLIGGACPIEQDDIDILLIKTDSSGNENLLEIFGDYRHNDATDLNITNDDAYIIAGYSFTPMEIPENLDLYVAKVDTNGNLLWAQCFGGESNDLGYYIQQAFDGSFIVAGSTQSYGEGGADFWLLKIGNQTFAEESTSEIKEYYFRFQNDPNPFNSTATLRYNLPITLNVRISVYNLLGQRVAILFEGAQQAGEHGITWDASGFPSGVYFARLEARGQSENIKMVLLR